MFWFGVSNNMDYNHGSTKVIPILEVAEAQARGNVRVIYSDIRQVLGVPFVNLIYRHLATAPAVLDCVWRSIRPHFVSGTFSTQAMLIRQEAIGIVGQWPVQYAQFPLESAQSAEVRLMHMYNEANSLNLTALLHLLGSPSSAAEHDPPNPEPPQQGIATLPATGVARSISPRLPAFEELQECDVTLIHCLNSYAEPAVPTIVASLYRHLAAWPTALQRVQEILSPLQKQGLLDEGRHLLFQAATNIAAAHPLVIPRLIDSFYEDYEARLRQFAEFTISKMIPIGTALSMSFDARPTISVAKSTQL